MPTFSHSKIECFRTCPRQYFYRYIAKVKLPDVPDQIALFFGSRIHEALEWLYGQVMIGRVPSRAETLAKYGTIWDEQCHENIVIREADMSMALYRSLGEKCVGDYYDAHEPFDDSTTIELEKQIRFPLDEAAGISMVGYIDRLAKTSDGVWQIHDYKSNKSLATQGEKDADPQLGYYEIGIRHHWPTIERVELHWHFVRFGETIVSTRSPDELVALREEALTTIHDVEQRGKDEDCFEPVETGLCNYCDFQSICPVRKHLFKVEQLPKNRFLKDPGVKLVDHWATLKEKKLKLNASIDEINEEIAEVQEALTMLAMKEGAEVIAGSEYEATVRQSEKDVFPRKTHEPEEYIELEQLLLESPFWEMASSVSISRLRTLWSHPEQLDPKLRDLLERFAGTEEKIRVGLRKRK